MTRLADRPNMLDRTGERWRPPLHVRHDTLIHRAQARARRLLDLQAASVWRDLSAELKHAHGVVVDVGCGAQPYRTLLPTGARYVGIDTVDAQGAFGYETPDTTYFEGEKWPLDDGFADVVLSTETLEHVLHPAVFLREAHRVLQAGGRLLLTVPFAARWHFVPRDYWRFTPSGLDHLLEEAGFVEVAIYARGNAFTVACQKTMAMLFPLLLPQSAGLGRQLMRLLALPMVPLLLLLAVMGHLSLRGAGGDDCLGYTAVAERH
jgi:SAM-dependent methyltransferase